MQQKVKFATSMEMFGKRQRRMQVFKAGDAACKVCASFGLDLCAIASISRAWWRRSDRRRWTVAVGGAAACAGDGIVAVAHAGQLR